MNSKWTSVFIALSVLSLVGCNSGGANSSSHSSTGTLSNVDCEYATYNQAEAIDSHRLQVSLPDGQCMGAKDIAAPRTLLPLEVGELNPGLVISETAQVYGGHQPTYVFTVTNTSNEDLCFIRIGGISVLDSSGTALIHNDLDYLRGDSFASLGIETNTCLRANSSGVIAEYLEYEPVDLSTAERIFIETISAKDIEGVAIPGPEFKDFSWGSELETARLVNRTGEVVDLDSSFLSIDYFDPQGYLMASLYMDPAKVGELVQIDEAFEIYKGAFHGAKVTEIHLVLNFEYYDESSSTKMLRSSRYFDPQELSEMQESSDMHKESLFLSGR